MPMIVNTAWLLEYLEPQCSHEELLAVLPRVGLEIEQSFELKQDLQAVRIGFVRTKEPLPGAEGLSVCQIELERGRTVPVVCAAEHEVREGWGVPVAAAGSVLPMKRSIKADQFHGVRSEGMICLDGEMGLLPRGSGMHHVTDESLLGRPLPAVIDIPEYLLELNVLPNRPDFLGLVGIAREVAAALRLKLRLPASLAPQATAAGPQVEIREPDLCTRYIGGLVRGVTVGPSPAWFKSRLLAVGMRPINNIVDVTNYVMYEWGQPLHAFDFDTLRGGRIVVRRMEPGETLELLSGTVIGADGQEGRKYTQPPLVIADAERPVALAGVMGGRATQTAERTTTVLLEAAHFDAVNIRRTANQVDVGLESRGTASSYRFERGTDPNTTLAGAVGRALHLIVELAGGTVAGPLTDVYPTPREEPALRLGAQRTSSYLGMPVEASTIRDCLGRLGMECSDGTAELTVRVPTWRVDVNDPVVLIEDVARMLGYDQIPVAPTSAAPTPARRALTDRLRQAVAEQLVSGGFYECRNPSLEAPGVSAWLGEPDDSITLSNWATREMSVLRRTLLTGLAATVQNNIRRGAQAVRFFEIDRAFDPRAAASRPDGSSWGRWRVGGIAGGTLQRSNWRAGGEAVDFYTLKGAVEDLLEALGARAVTFRATDRAPFVAGAAAEVLLGSSQAVGYLGEVDPQALQIDRLTFRLFAFELALEPLAGAFSSLPAYRPVPRQPAVTRDLAVVVPLAEPYAHIAATLHEFAGPTLELLHLVDRYQGPQVAAGHQSLAFHLVFRDPERTLTADEVTETTTHIVAALKERCGAELRA